MRAVQDGKATCNTVEYTTLICIVIGCYFYAMVQVIYQTRETVFHRDIQTPTRELKIRRAAEYFKRNSRGLDSR